LAISEAPGSVIASQQVTRSQRLGALQQTNRKLDLAIEGPGYFQLQDGARVLYSRRGDFHIDEQGVLRGTNGLPVAGAGGEVRLPDSEVTIRSDGTIDREGEAIGRISIAQFASNSPMTYLGDGVYQSELLPVVDTENEPRIRQGFVEASNVRPMDEMIQMLEITRRFGASTQALKAYDEMLGMVFDDLGVF
jgi:flagellar basal body rod protein FlgG